MSVRKHVPLAEVIAQDTQFKKALKRDFPELVRLAKEVIKANPNSKASKDLDLQLKKIQKNVRFPQHGICFGTLFTECEVEEEED